MEAIIEVVVLLVFVLVVVAGPLGIAAICLLKGNYISAGIGSLVFAFQLQLLISLADEAEFAYVTLSVMLFVGVTLGLAPVHGALKLARPGSWWSRRRYSDADRERSEAKYGLKPLRLQSPGQGVSSTGIDLEPPKVVTIGQLTQELVRIWSSALGTALIMIVGSGLLTLLNALLLASVESGPRTLAILAAVNLVGLGALMSLGYSVLIRHDERLHSALMHGVRRAPAMTLVALCFAALFGTLRTVADEVDRSLNLQFLTAVVASTVIVVILSRFLAAGPLIEEGESFRSASRRSWTSSRRSWRTAIVAASAVALLLVVRSWWSPLGAGLAPWLSLAVGAALTAAALFAIAITTQAFRALTLPPTDHTPSV